MGPCFRRDDATDDVIETLFGVSWCGGVNGHRQGASQYPQNDGSLAKPERRHPNGRHGTLLQLADLQIRPPTMQPEVLSVDPSIDILPE
jgi:hypothetical protein